MLIIECKRSLSCEINYAGLMVLLSFNIIAVVMNKLELNLAILCLRLRIIPLFDGRVIL